MQTEHLNTLTSLTTNLFNLKETGKCKLKKHYIIKKQLLNIFRVVGEIENTHSHWICGN